MCTLMSFNVFAIRLKCLASPIAKGSAPRYIRSQGALSEMVTMTHGSNDPIDVLLRRTVSHDASDLHFRSGQPPILRCHGRMQRMPDVPALTSDELVRMIGATVPERLRERFASARDLDFAYDVPQCGRFRVNVLRDRFGIGAVFRRIPPKVVTADDLGLPRSIRRLCALRKGLVLVTGPTGSGKSTTLCAMVDLINRTRSDHIVTIEDPI